VYLAVSICLSGCVYLSICLSGCVYLSIRLCLSVYPAVSICLSGCVYLSIWLCLSVYLALWGEQCVYSQTINKRTSIWSPGLCVVCCYISQRPRIVDSMISELNPFCCDKPSVNRLLEPPRRSHDSFCDSRVSPEIMLILCVSILRACCTAPPHCHRRFFARALHCFGSGVGGCFQEPPVFV
jgi:hypothetical protein